MATLGVNIDHIANVRQARQTIEPDPVQYAFLAELGGADSITVHLREDRRHIQDRDVFLLKETIKTTLNLEMAATEEMLEISKKLLPDYVTLVPEKREEVTTEGGLDVKNAALNAGALGCAISGAGPSILALCKKENGKAVSHSMVKAWEKSGVASRAPYLNVQTSGSQYRTISDK